jgi:uncharacterized protein (DUF924 family)
MTTPKEVLDFWLDEVGPAGWYSGEPALDATIRDRFGATWSAAAAGGLADWCCDARGALAFLIVTDQFSRNIFRDDPRAFSTDRKALAVAVPAIHRRWDLTIPEPERQFFYLPLMHSESTADQDHCVRLMLTRLADTGAGNLRHARAHREVIRKFGRFPSRNAALGRESSQAERAFLANAGYAKVLDALDA